MNLPELRLRRDDAIECVMSACEEVRACAAGGFSDLPIRMAELEESVRLARRMTDHVWTIERWEKYGEET